MSLKHPPSRLSPPPGTRDTDIIDSAHMDLQGGDRQASPDEDSKDGIKDGKRNDAPKRGYRACVHCRLRKARCDLGDVNSPSEPPCTRCRREQRNCVFLPSKRRKKNNIDSEEAMLLQAMADEAGPSRRQPDVQDMMGGMQFPNLQQLQQQPSQAAQLAQLQAQYQAQNKKRETWQGYPMNTMPPSMFDRQGQMYDVKPTIPPPNALQQMHQYNPEYSAPAFDFTLPDPRPPTLPEPRPPPKPINNPTPQSVDSTSTSALSPAARARKKRDAPDATRRIVVASFANETDALEILAHAATDEDKESPADKPASRAAASLANYVLIKSGILDEGMLWALTRHFFEHHHPVLPIVQTPRIPRTPLQLPNFATDEPFLLSVIVAVASRYHIEPRMQRIHAETWLLVRQVLAEYTLAGMQANMGLVEGALLLAEFLPREINAPETENMRSRLASLLGSPGSSASPQGGSHQAAATIGGGGLHGADNRRSWAMTGLAIRAAYGLQLDEAALVVEGERSPAEERARLDWTWCYLYDRTIGLRTGLAFWSRGPTLCFTGYSHISQTGEAAARLHFPSMLSPTPAESYGGKSMPGERQDSGMTPEQEAQIRGAGADSASLIQSLTELTQLMTNAHDTLYPNRMRTSDLVKKGAYFRHLDSYSRALDAFKAVWHPRQWQSEHLRELTWCTYEMVRLYISSFAFQAHVQRAWARAEDEQKAAAPGDESAPLSTLPGIVGGKEGIQLFPRGSATSPDALYIYASIDAANEILNICLRLGAMGVLGYLPSRYLINFVFGGVFALKAGYSGAVNKAEIFKTRDLVDRVSAALVTASQDKEHPACRYGQMLRLLCRKLEELSDQSASPSTPQAYNQAVPSRYPSPEPHEHPTSSHVQPNTNWEHLLLNSAPRQPFMADAPPAAASHPHHVSFAMPNAMATLPAMPPSVSATPQPPLDFGNPGAANQQGLFDFDVDVSFNMDGFWDDFTLAEGTGFPFR